jgi:hypothetical protein
MHIWVVGSSRCELGKVRDATKHPEMHSPLPNVNSAEVEKYCFKCKWNAFWTVIFYLKMRQNPQTNIFICCYSSRNNVVVNKNYKQPLFYTQLLQWASTHQKINQKLSCYWAFWESRRERGNSQNSWIGQFQYSWQRSFICINPYFLSYLKK